MRQERRSTGIVIEVPDAYDTPTAAAARRGRRRAADETAETPNFAAIDAALIDALLAEDMELLDEFEYEADPRAVRSGRARSVDEQTLGISMEAVPGATAIALIEQDGVYSWQFPIDEEVTSRGRVRRGAGPRTLRFEIPLSDAARGAGTRSIFSTAKDLVGRVKGRILGTATDAVLGLMESKVEQGMLAMRPGGVSKWQRLADPESLTLPERGPARILLFVHGTFSSTIGSFHSLASLSEGHRLIEDMWQRYDAVIGFDHPTLSVDPEQNALELLSLLRRLPAQALVVDGVSYSRGGLVLRSLFESLLPRSGLDARLERAIFVGATNDGTALADPENWRDLIDVYTNLVLGAARAIALLPNAAPVTSVVGNVVKGLGVAVKFLVDHAIDKGGVPGLAAMAPGGDFVRRLNQTQPGQPAPDAVNYFAITSDFEGGASAGGLANELPRKFLMRAADPLVDRLMNNAPNDLVVDTPSMTAIDIAGGHQVREVLDFGKNSVVYHTVYFTQNAVADRFRTWLQLGDGSGRRRSIPEEEGLLAQIAGEVRSGSDAAAVARVPVAESDATAPSRPVLNVEVIWDDIREAPGDVYAVGHYVGVAPQRAELALDKVVSDSSKEEDLVLTGLTRSNVLRGQLGEISFFPWGGKGKRNRLIAVCGMGDYGPFGTQELRLLHRNLAQSVAALPDPRTICTVLIGAGEGAMRADNAVTQLVLGLGDAIRLTGRGDRIRRVRIVEMMKARADAIHATLNDLARSGGFPVEIKQTGNVVAGGHGLVSDEVARTLLIRAASLAGHGPDTPQSFEALETHLPEDIRPAVWLEAAGDDGEPTESPLRWKLRTLWEDTRGSIDELTRVVALGPQPTSNPQRITFIRSDDVYKVSAITDNATVPEREIGVQEGLIRDATVQMTDPFREDMPDLSEMLFRLTLPRDFRDLMASDAPLIFEVDRHTASIHWEMLASGIGESSYEPIGLSRQVARQLRTQYSESVAFGGGARERDINVLVIGDPGDPDKREDLPHARAEARRVAAFFQSLATDHGLPVRVQQLIGAPNYPDRGGPPATRLEVIRRLMKGDIDVVHYAGHGDFDEENPQNTGWLFHDGLLTAGEIERVDLPPSLVVANACLSGRLSATRGAGPATRRRLGEAGLLPSLADEFFNRGVRNYIGTAWEIDDAGAVAFAQAFYRRFFTPGSNGEYVAIGEALLEARRAVRTWEDSQPNNLVLWAAYQHYGDPGFRYSNM